jgi:cell division protein FtsW (lipid II flippase)
LLGSTLALGVDPNDSGVRIWLGYGGYYFQPSELIKILLVIFLASYLDDVRGLVGGPSIGGRRSIRVAYLLPVALLGGMCLLLLLVQRDLGPAVLFYAVTLTLLYLATERALYVALGLAAFGLGATVVYRLFAVAQLRIDVWRDPWVEASGRGYQIVQGLVALANGGLLGTGLGRGHPEILPAAYTDFPFAVIGEELGFVGAAGVIGLYGLVALRGYAIAARTSHPFSTLLAAGLTTVLSFQAFIILAGNLKLLPLTGITLPFVSFGGSSLLTNFLILGLLHRISAEPTIDGPRAPPR